MAFGSFRTLYEQTLSTSTNTSTAVSKLICTSVNFVTAGVLVGDEVRNETDSTTTTVTNIDSAIQLALAADIFTASGKTFRVRVAYNAADTENIFAEDLNEVPKVVGTAEKSLATLSLFTGGTAANKERITSAGVLTNISLTGGGSNTLALRGEDVTSGTVADARLSSNVPKLDASQTIAAEWTLNKLGTATGTANQQGSYALKLLGSFWTGSAEIAHYARLRLSASTTVNEAPRFTFDIDGTEYASLDKTGFGYGIVSPLAPLHGAINTAAVNSVLPVLYMDRNTTGSPAAGLGSSLIFRSESSDGTMKSAGEIEGVVSTASTPTFASYMTFRIGAYDVVLGQRVQEMLRLSQTGLGISTISLNEALTIDGRISLKETTAPLLTAQHGKVYVLSSDGKLYFMDRDGFTYNLTAPGIAGSGSAKYLVTWATSTSLGSSILYDTGSKLGIGTITPATIFSISGTRPDITLYGASATTKSHFAKFAEAGDGTGTCLSDNASYDGVNWTRDDISLTASAIDSSGTIPLRIRRAGAGAGNISWSTFLYMTSSGYLGLGTSSSLTSQLTVKGNIELRNASDLNQFHLSTSDGAYLSFVETGVTTRMVIAATTGRVGIATITPDTTLHVAGTFKVTGTTTLNGVAYTWPASDGINDQVLTTNAVGTLSWTNKAGGGGGGITSLGGQTGAAQTFANDTNVTITSATNTHTLGWTGTLAVSRGGSGAGTFTANGVLLGNTTSAFQATAAGAANQMFKVPGAGGAPVFGNISDLISVTSPITVSGTATLTLGISATPSFTTVTCTTSLTSPLILNAGSLTLRTTATAGADDIVLELASVEKMRIVEAGRVGIGTATPDAASLLHVAGVIVAAQGSAAAPTYAFSTAITTGLFDTGAGMGWATAGAETMRADSTGLTIASGKVIILRGSGGKLQLRNEADSATGDLLSRDASDLVKLGNATVWSGIAILPGAAETARFTTTGRLGVGVAGPTATVHIKAGSTAASSAPIKLNSGTVMTTPEAGALEFTTDSLYFTITTGPARKTIAFLDSNITGTAANVTGTVAVANGGTGQTSYTDGQLLIGNSTGNTLTKASLTAGSGITITPGAGSITIATAGAGITSLGGQTGGTQTFANDTNVTISSATNVHTLGWSGQLTVSRGGTGATAFTQGSIVFAGVSGVYTQNNTNFFWDNSSIRMGIATATPTNTISLGGDATRKIWLERNTTTNGSLLTVEAGGAQSGGTNLQGGEARISSGIATGTGSSYISFYTATAGATGLADRTPTEKVRIDAVGRILVGRTSYLDSSNSLLTISSSGQTDVELSAHSSVGSPAVRMYRSRGTLVSPTIVSNGDTVFAFYGNGYDGTSYINSAQITFQIDGTPGATDMPGRIMFLTTPDGGVTSLERMRITSGGNVGIGTTSPQALLHLSNTSAATSMLLGVSSGVGGYTALTAQLSAVSGGYAELQSIKSAGSAYGDLILNSSGGNVGIGTASPTTFKLQVDGTIGPNTDNTYNLGSGSVRWASIFGMKGRFYTNVAVAGSGDDPYPSNPLYVNATVGNVRVDATVTIASVSSNRHIPIDINGTVYKLLIAT